MFVLKTVAHSAGCALEAREILSGVRSLPKGGGPVYPESVALPSRGDTVKPALESMEITGSLHHGMCCNRTSTTLGGSVWEDLLETFMGGGRGAGLSLRLCWKTFLAQTH